jgi:hypothetical protein
MTAWRRRGVVVAPPATHGWWRRSAGIPTCLPLADDLWRVWFGGRDAHGRAGVLCADLDPRDGLRVRAVHDVPTLGRGAAGAFDEAGLWVSAVVADGDRLLAWYTGMRLGGEGRYALAIGLAESRDGGLTFRKPGDGPVLASAPDHASFATTPCVRRTPAGYAMWYSHGLGWRDVGGRREPFYELRVAHSRDGIAWMPAAAPALSIDGTPWGGLTRPWLDDDGATLWFSARGPAAFRGPSADAYRLYRAPVDGERVRAGAIEPVDFVPPPRPGDWDGWMQVAPCVVRAGGRRVLFYNGDDFGAAGFGWAEAEDA